MYQSNTRLKPFFFKILKFNFLVTIGATTLQAQKDSAPIELEPFTVRDSAQGLNQTVLPTEYPAVGVYDGITDVMEIPRAVTVITPRLQRDLGIRDYAQLNRIGAGTQRPNYLGIAGTPFLRGDDAGLFFNGMRRAYQLLAFPQSFNSFEAQTIVKGPAPAHLGPTQAGGYVNQYAKRPSGLPQKNVSATLGSYDFYQGEVDVSAPAQLFDRPADYRVSLNVQDAESYYRHIDEDKFSLYAAIQSHLTPTTTLFSGFEIYDFDGNTNLGWNWLTQDLIDHRRYQFDNNEVTKVSGKEGVTAPEDYAEATDFIYFADFEWLGTPDRTIKNQIFLEYFDAKKREPSNGFSLDANHFAIENKFTIVQELNALIDTQLTYGFSLRYNDVTDKNAFGDPNARDVSTDSGTSPIGSGGTANHVGDYIEAGLFGTVVNPWTEHLTTITSLRLETTHFDADKESAVGSGSGSEDYYNASFSPVYKLNDWLSLYGVLQKGTALVPSEAGAVTSEANFAESELYELGLKGNFDTLFFSLAAYYWDTAEFDSRSGLAEKFRAKGVEFELNYQPSRFFYLVGSFNAQRTYRRGGAPERLDPGPDYGYNPGGDTPENNRDLVVPGTPEIQAKLFAVVTLPQGLSMGGGPIWSSEFWTSYDRATQAPSSIVWNGFASYAYRGWTLRLSVDNIFDERYFAGSDPNFLGNVLITQEPGREWRLALSRRF